jgi:hypothetical protein
MIYHNSIMATFKELLAPHSMSTDVDTTHSYADVYESYFSTIRDQSINVLLVGVEHNNYLGGFLHACYDYFPNATFYVVDHNSPEKFDTFFNEPNINLYSQASIHDHDFIVNTFVNTDIRFDLIIEDVSPRALANMAKIVKEYSVLLKPNGMMFIEDLEYPDNTVVLDAELPAYLQGCSQIFDLRTVKGRYDDILYLVTAPASLPAVVAQVAPAVAPVSAAPAVEAPVADKGITGPVGVSEDTDLSGPVSDTGATGTIDVSGDKGITGPVGVSEDTDLSGPVSDTGATGTIDVSGDTGATGTNP